MQGRSSYLPYVLATQTCKHQCMMAKLQLYLLKNCGTLINDLCPELQRWTFQASIALLQNGDVIGVLFQNTQFPNACATCHNIRICGMTCMTPSVLCLGSREALGVHLSNAVISATAAL